MTARKTGLVCPTCKAVGRVHTMQRHVCTSIQKKAAENGYVLLGRHSLRPGDELEKALAIVKAARIPFLKWRTPVALMSNRSNLRLEWVDCALGEPWVDEILKVHPGSESLAKIYERVVHRPELADAIVSAIALGADYFQVWKIVSTPDV